MNDMIGIGQRPPGAASPPDSCLPDRQGCHSAQPIICLKTAEMGNHKCSLLFRLPNLHKT